ncbi:MAG: hypothetical protein ACREQQ_02580 [Candidatus Binatia bacterium]
MDTPLLLTQPRQVLLLIPVLRQAPLALKLLRLPLELPSLFREMAIVLLEASPLLGDELLLALLRQPLLVCIALLISFARLLPFSFVPTLPLEKPGLTPLLVLALPLARPRRLPLLLFTPLPLEKLGLMPLLCLAMLLALHRLVPLPLVPALPLELLGLAPLLLLALPLLVLRLLLLLFLSMLLLLLGLAPLLLLALPLLVLRLPMLLLLAALLVPPLVFFVIPCFRTNPRQRHRSDGHTHDHPIEETEFHGAIPSNGNTPAGRCVAARSSRVAGVQQAATFA